MKLRALDIQTALWRDLSASSRLVMPNFTPSSWWECDMMSVTKSGYWSEFEIKISVSDFKADAKKCDGGGWKRCRETGKSVHVGERFKHQELALGSEKGPSFFWYVVPEEIKDKVTVPEWAGLKLAVWHPPIMPTSFHDSIPACVTVHTEKSAPRLHNVKISQAVEDQAKTACYYRYWNLKTDMAKSVRRELQREKSGES